MFGCYARPVQPFRFGVLVKNVVDADGWRATARHVEELGYDTLVMPDHFHVHFAPLPALLAAAEATTDLRVSPFVLANDYRHPVLLAKEAATVDVLSGGRLDLALGTGWYQRDYDMLGMELRRAGDRVSRLEESVVLLKRLWTEDDVAFEGRWYTVHDATISPRPVQRPHPPIMIGGSGPRMLRLAGREADIVSINGAGTATQLEEKIEILRDAAGDRFGSLRLNTNVDVEVTDDAGKLYAREAAEGEMTEAEVADSPSLLYGTVEELRDQLVSRRDRFGLTYYNVPMSATEAFAPLAKELGSTV
jgi:probable F420-dependent oxidoreductase